MIVIDTKKDLARLIDWSADIPGYLFTSRDYKKVYFYETPLLRRLDVLEELSRLVTARFGGDILISVGHESDGSFDEKQARNTTIVLPGGDINAGRADFERYMATMPEYPWEGTSIATNPSRDWVLYDYPAEWVGVIVSKVSLDDLMPDPESVFDFPRLRQLSPSPAFGVPPYVYDAFARNYSFDESALPSVHIGNVRR